MSPTAIHSLCCDVLPLFTGEEASVSLPLHQHIGVATLRDETQSLQHQKRLTLKGAMCAPSLAFGVTVRGQLHHEAVGTWTSLSANWHLDGDIENSFAREIQPPKELFLTESMTFWKALTALPSLPQPKKKTETKNFTFAASLGSGASKSKVSVDWPCNFAVLSQWKENLEAGNMIFILNCSAVSFSSQILPWPFDISW